MPHLVGLWATETKQPQQNVAKKIPEQCPLLDRNIYIRNILANQQNFKPAQAATQPSTRFKIYFYNRKIKLQTSAAQKVHTQIDQYFKITSTDYKYKKFRKM